MKGEKRLEKFRPFIPYHLDDRGRHEAQVILEKHGAEGYGVRQLLKGIFSEYGDERQMPLGNGTVTRGFDAEFTIRMLAGYCGVGTRPGKLIEVALKMHGIFLQSMDECRRLPGDESTQLLGFYIVNHEEISKIPLDKLRKNPASSRYATQKIRVFWPNLLKENEAVMNKGKKDNEKKEEGIPIPSVLEQNISKSPCPECGEPLILKKGKFGEFASCSRYPDCEYKRSIQDDDWREHHEESPLIASLKQPVKDEGLTPEEREKAERARQKCMEQVRQFQKKFGKVGGELEKS